MAEKEKTASADKKSMPKSVVLKGAKIVRTKTGSVSAPELSCPLPGPDKGQTVEFTLDNGVTYCGVVADVVEVDDTAIIEFKDGISPLS